LCKKNNRRKNGEDQEFPDGKRTKDNYKTASVKETKSFGTMTEEDCAVREERRKNL
jgi:hypothetical protein